MNRFDNRGRKLDFKAGQIHVQIDAFAEGGRGACCPKAARTVLEMIGRIASLHDSQGRHGAPISITRTQAATLLAKLRLPTGELSWHGHPVRVVEDEVKR
jgi:hypothetical protein